MPSRDDFRGSLGSWKGRKRETDAERERERERERDDTPSGRLMGKCDVMRVTEWLIE